MQLDKSCQWISVTKGLVTYHTIVTFCGTWLLVILILFCTCKCSSTYFAFISSFCTNVEALPMICDTIERLDTIFISYFHYKFCTLRFWMTRIITFGCCLQVSIILLIFRPVTYWFRLILCLPLSVCLIFALDCLTSSVPWAFGWH